MMAKYRILTGDTPTGRLHLGHWEGSLKKRIELQNQNNCCLYVLIANLHAFITNPAQGQMIYQNTFEVALDYLAAGIDPNKSFICIQSEIPAIAELTYFFSMLVPFARLMRNPTLKEELYYKKLEKSHSFGFLLYPIGQIADILAFRPTKVPVGADQLPHLEMAREVAKRFNYIYQEEFFPIIESITTETSRLAGIGPPDKKGVLPKMSKSLGNAIYLSDTPELIQKKVMTMYTDPNRIHATDPGTIQNNPLWQLHDAFNPDKVWVTNAKMQYQQGKIGDVACKRQLIEVLIDFLKPIQNRRKEYAQDPKTVMRIVKEGTNHANIIAQATLKEVKRITSQSYFS